MEIKRKNKNSYHPYAPGDLVNIAIDNSDAGLGIILNKVFSADGLEEYYQIEMCNNGAIINCFFYELALIS